MASPAPASLVSGGKKIGDHRSYRNGDINSYINSCMDTSEKTKVTTSTRHIAIVLKSGTPICNSEVLDTAGRKMRKRRRRRRTQVIPNRYPFYANAESQFSIMT